MTESLESLLWCQGGRWWRFGFFRSRLTWLAVWAPGVHLTLGDGSYDEGHDRVSHVALGHRLSVSWRHRAARQGAQPDPDSSRVVVEGE